MIFPLFIINQWFVTKLMSTRIQTLCSSSNIISMALAVHFKGGHNFRWYAHILYVYEFVLNTICSTFNCYRFTYYIIDIHSMPFNVTCISISWLQRFAWLNWFKWPQPSPDTLKAWKLKGENYWTKITGGVAKGGTPPSISSHWSSSSTFEIWINDSTNFGPWCTCEYLPPLKKTHDMTGWKICPIEKKRDIFQLDEG